MCHLVHFINNLEEPENKHIENFEVLHNPYSTMSVTY